MSLLIELGQEEISKVQTLDFERLETLENKTDTQREDWLKQRIGRFTASEMHRLLTYENKPDELPKGAETYILEKVVEVLTGEAKEGFKSESMQWGNDNELEAIETFARKRDISIKNTGENQIFVKYGKHAGGTPDGVGHGFDVEVKCPNSITHFVYVTQIKDSETLKAVKKEYYYQMQSLMLFTGKKYGYFISYDPRYKMKSKRLHFVRIERNEKDIEFIKKLLEMAINLKKEMLNEFRSSNNRK